MIVFKNVVDEAMKDLSTNKALGAHSNINLPKDKVPDSNIDWNNLDFESGGEVSAISPYDFESDRPIYKPQYYESEADVYKDLVIPTAKAMIKVPTAVAGSILLTPAAGIVSLAEMAKTEVKNKLFPYRSVIQGVEPTPTGGDPLENAMTVYKNVMKIPSKLITTTEEAKAIDNISKVMKPIEMAGEGWRLIGQGIEKGLSVLGLPSSYIEPLLATMGEAAAVFAVPGVIKGLSESTAFRMMSVTERGLVVQSLAETMRKNPSMTEGELLRTYNNPSWIAEALSKRSIVEDYANVKNYAGAKTREVAINNVVDVKVKSPEKTVERPVDINPDYTFTSQKGNYYEKIGEDWFDSKGKKVDNKFVINAAEAGRTPFESDAEVAAEDARIADIEKKYGKNIDDITDDEIENYFIEKESEGPTEEEIRKDLEDVQPVVPNYNKEFQGIKPTEAEQQKMVEDYADEVMGRKEEPAPETSFREKDPEVTKIQRSLLPSYNRIDNADTLTAKIENDVNSYLDGDKSIDIDQVRELTSDLAEASSRWASGSESPGGIFQDMSLAELNNFSEYVGKLDGWVRELERANRKMRTVWDEWKSEIDATASGEKPAFYYVAGDKNIIDYAKSKGLKVIKDVTDIGDFIAVKESIEGKKISNELIKLSKERDRIFKTDNEELIDNWNYRFSKLLGYSEELANNIKGKYGYGPRDLELSRLNKYSTTRTKLYSGIPLDEAGKQIIKLFNKLTGRDKVNSLTEEPSKPITDIRKKVRELIYTRTAGLGVANYDTNKFVNSVEQRTSKDQREVMPFVIEKTDIPDELNRPDLQKTLKKYRKYLEPIAEEIKDHFEQGFLRVKANLKELSAKQIRDYVTHLWDIPRNKQAEAVRWFQTQDRFMERRFIPTYKDGIERGFKPKVLDISEIIKIHDNVGNRAIENVKFIKALMTLKQDDVSLITRSAEAPLDWVEVNYPALTRRIPLEKTDIKRKGEFIKEVKVRVHPDLVRPLRTIFEDRFDHPVISAYEALNGIMKKSMLSLSLFHHQALGETGFATMGPSKTLGIMFNPVKIYGSLVKGNYEMFKKEDIAKDAIEHGVQFGATADIPVGRIQHYLDRMADATQDKIMLGRITKLMAGMNSAWDKGLWNYLHDTLKLYAYESLVGKIDPNMNAEMARKSKREIGQFINDTFGGQNWENLMMTPKEVQMLTWNLLSSDWTFSTTRQALSPTGIGKIYNETSGLRKSLGWKFWARAALYFGIGMNLLNVLYRTKDIEDNPQYYQDKEWEFLDKTMLGNSPGKKTYLFIGRYSDGSERYLRWGKQFRDFFELVGSPLKKIGGKIAPVPQLLSEFFTGHSTSGFENDDIYGKEGFDKALGIMKTVGKAFLPISIQRLLQENIETKPLDIMMQSSKGMSRYSAMEYFKKAIVSSDEEMLRDTYAAALRNNLPAYSLFTSALGWTENEIMDKINDGIKDIEDAKAMLAASTNAYDKKRYGMILARMQKEQADRRAGIKLLDVAIERARSYEEVGLNKVPKLPSKNERYVFE